MTKPQLVSTSLVAVIPGGFAIYITLMAMLNNMGSMPTMLQVCVITLFVMSVILVAVLPGYLWLFYGYVRPATAPAAKSVTKEAKAAAAPAKDEVEVRATQEFEMDEDGVGVVEDFGASDEFEVDESDEDEGMFAADDEFEFEEFDFDEEK